MDGAVNINFFFLISGAQVKLRGPVEDPWSHGEKWKQTGWSCSYCNARKGSGGVTRLRNHLAGLQGDVVHALMCQGL